jgi:hypothetical protein
MYFYCYVYVFFHCASWNSSATLNELFPCFFLSCKANARVKPAKLGTDRTKLPIFSCCSMYCLFFVLFYVLFVLCRSVYCLCANVYWMCIVLLPPGGYPIAVKKYITSTIYLNQHLKIFRTQFVCTFMTYWHTKFHIPASSCTSH